MVAVDRRNLSAHTYVVMRRQTFNRLRVVKQVGIPQAVPNSSDTGPNPTNTFQWAKRMYAIVFDLEQERLERYYPGNYPENAYNDICRVLGRHGFRRQQGSVYFGDDKSGPVQCMMAVQDLGNIYPWFKKVVKDIRMLRVEENNDLMPVLGGLELDLGPTKAAE